MKQRVFICGSMGVPNYYNIFEEVANQLEALGYSVMNPTQLIAPTTERAEGIRKCLDYIDKADIVFFLSNWHESPGAHVEYTYCLYMKKPLAFALSDLQSPTVLPV